jgi:hypothetical protein
MAHRRTVCVVELRMASARIRFQKVGSGLERTLRLPFRESVLARGIFVGGWGSLDPKENISVPVCAGNLLGDGREGFVTLPVPLKTI